MEEHNIQTVIVEDTEKFKGEEVFFEATYEYCENTDDYLETEEMVKANSLAMKDAYRERKGLLTSSEIIVIRDKYRVSQKDFSEILGWGMATITRYENHQVQDCVHDDVLRKIDSDPKWFIDMLSRAKDKLTSKAYNKYYVAANKAYREKKDQYLVDLIEAIYADYDDDLITGNVKLNLNKVREIINYYASKVISLHKVKLMKMLWYGDCLSYKRTGKAMTGLVYSALPMGAVPEGADQIIYLDGIQFETIHYRPDRLGYKFYPVEGIEIKELNEEEYEILDTIIETVGHLNAGDIIERMHNEVAYKKTDRNCIIPFSYADDLTID